MQHAHTYQHSQRARWRLVPRTLLQALTPCRPVLQSQSRRWSLPCSDCCTPAPVRAALAPAGRPVDRSLAAACKRHCTSLHTYPLQLPFLLTSGGHCDWVCRTDCSGAPFQVPQTALHGPRGTCPRTASFCVNSCAAHNCAHSTQQCSTRCCARNKASWPCAAAPCYHQVHNAACTMHGRYA